MGERLFLFLSLIPHFSYPLWIWRNAVRQTYVLNPSLRMKAKHQKRERKNHCSSAFVWSLVEFLLMVEGYERFVSINATPTVMPRWFFLLKNKKKVRALLWILSARGLRTFSNPARFVVGGRLRTGAEFFWELPDHKTTSGHNVIP